MLAGIGAFGIVMAILFAPVLFYFAIAEIKKNRKSPQEQNPAEKQIRS